MAPPELRHQKGTTTMNVVSVNASETPVRTGTEGLVAVGRRAWSAVARLALVAGLAVALLVGTLALGPRSEASAATMTCEDAIMLGNMYQASGLVMNSFGSYQQASYYFGKASAYYSFC
jgi:hypothetical protein